MAEQQQALDIHVDPEGRASRNASDQQQAQIQTQIKNFHYSAIDSKNGSHVDGELSGNSAYAVRTALRRIGLNVQRMHEIKTRSHSAHPFVRFMQQAWQKNQRNKRSSQRADLFDAIATMIAAGLPLERCLQNLSSAGTRKANEQHMLQHLRDRVREGEALSDACAAHPDWFDHIDIAMIEAGQHAGELAMVLRSLSEFLQNRGSMQHQFIAALIYPCMLLCAALGVTLFLSISTLPQLMSMLESAQLHTPLLTQIVAAGGQFVWQWWYLILIALVAIVCAVIQTVKRLPKTHRISIFLSSNLITRTLHRNRVAQVASTLARLQRSGIPLANALDIVSDSAPSESIRQLLHNAASAIRDGKDFSEAMRNNDLLDDEFAQLLQLGEESGELPSMLERIAERYQRSATRSTENLAAFLEPVAVLVLACLIGCIALAAVLPLMEMTKIL